MYADIPSSLTLQLRSMYYTGLLLQVKGDVIVLCVLVFWQCSAIPKLVTVLMEQKQIRIRTTRSVVQ